MTAEIGILNKNAVALAADSAVTLRNPASQKVYNTANKLFNLSKYHPVGIMFYGSADFMGVPWETVVKMYREQLKDKNFDYLAEFAADFVGYIENNRLLFPEELQAVMFELMVDGSLHFIRSEIDKAVKKQIDDKGEIARDEATQIFRDTLVEEHGNWQALSRLELHTDEYQERLIDRYKDKIRSLAEKHFGNFPWEEYRAQITEVCTSRITADWWRSDSGGIVVAGFGKLDVFPVLNSYTAEAVLADKLRIKLLEHQSNDMNKSRIASIVPFAQAEIVFRFLQGIDPEYKLELKQYLSNLLTSEYPEMLLAKFGSELGEEQQRDAKAELIKTGRTAVETFDNQWNEWQFKKFVSPVLEIVGDLPKEDLAAMAESLVNLTSFKRRITAEAETVGGPIDVAVISKGDGFVWIKRKHYFSPELNPGFFANYYRRHNEGGE